MRPKLIVILVIFLSTLLFDCGKAPDTISSSSSVNFTGVYTGTETGLINGKAFSTAISVTLTQTNEDVLGVAYNSDGSPNGTISGTVEGSQITSAHIITASCQGTYSGTLTYTSGTIQGTLTGTGACGVLSAVVNISR